MLSKMDDDLFLSCVAKYKDKEEKHVSLEAKHKLTWEKLESAAACRKWVTPKRGVN
jgi:serine/threonine-protein phosphatase 2A regulatory subunit B'